MKAECTICKLQDAQFNQYSQPQSYEREFTYLGSYQSQSYLSSEVNGTMPPIILNKVKTVVLYECPVCGWLRRGE